jgi:uroporphyrin-III C-methyltransferase
MTADDKGRTRGTVFLVGAGPGAPDLLTLRAARVLERADIVFHDALVHPETVALAASAQKVAVGKRCGRHSTAQRFINKRLVDAASTCDVVVRLKGGDPMLFGRAQEEIAALEAAGIRYEVVPGVTAALAASAQLGVAMTQRGVARSVAFVTPRVGNCQADSDWAQALARADAGAIYMGAGQAREISVALVGAGKDPSTPIAVVVNATLPDSQTRFTTLGRLASLQIDSTDGPALILVGSQFARAVDAADAENAQQNARAFLLAAG